MAKELWKWSKNSLNNLALSFIANYKNYQVLLWLARQPITNNLSYLITLLFGYISCSLASDNSLHTACDMQVSSLRTRSQAKAVLLQGFLISTRQMRLSQNAPEGIRIRGERVVAQSRPRPKGQEPFALFARILILQAELPAHQ